MTIMTEEDRRRGPRNRDAGASLPEPEPGIGASAVSIERKYELFPQGKRFLENARNDQWRANILIQLAESVGDRIDSLCGYIDMLLAMFSPQLPDLPLGKSSTDEQEKYLGWFAELGTIERSLPR